MTITQPQIQYTEARDYAFANPETTSAQLRDRFQSLMPEQCRKLMHRARKNARQRGVELLLPTVKQQQEQLQSFATSYADANPDTTPEQLQQLFPMSIRHAAKIMRLAQPHAEIDPKKQSRSTEHQVNMIAARQYALANPVESGYAIAKKHGVSPSTLQKWRRVDAMKVRAVADAKVASQPKQRRGKGNRLYAVLADGSQVDPRKVRDVAKIERFIEVAV